MALQSRKTLPRFNSPAQGEVSALPILFADPVLERDSPPVQVGSTGPVVVIVSLTQRADEFVDIELLAAAGRFERGVGHGISILVARALWQSVAFVVHGDLSFEPPDSRLEQTVSYASKGHPRRPGDPGSSRFEMQLQIIMMI